MPTPSPHLDERPDAGDIIAQEPAPIAEDDYIEDVLNKVEFAIAAMVKKYLPLLADDRAPRLPQDVSKSNYRRLRTDADSIINWNTSVCDIHNHIRAISHPYPGADLLLNGENLRFGDQESKMYLRRNPFKIFFLIIMLLR